VQKTVFEEVLQIPPDMVAARFGYMLEAFKYGAPPHGGIALGFDRLIAILCNTPSIRDVIAFPKTAKGTCLMTDSPSGVSARQLKDLHIEVKAAVKKAAKPGPAAKKAEPAPPPPLAPGAVEVVDVNVETDVPTEAATELPTAESAEALLAAELDATVVDEAEPELSTPVDEPVDNVGNPPCIQG
jgi:hypothetical protein